MSNTRSMRTAELKRELRIALEDAMLAGVGLYESNPLTNKIDSIAAAKLLTEMSHPAADGDASEEPAEAAQAMRPGP